MTARQHESVRLPHGTEGALQLSLSYSGQMADWAVLYVHGFGSTRGGEKSQVLEEACGRRNWTYAAFDFRGHGESTGTLLELRGSGLLEDMEAVRAFLAGKGIRRLYPVGSSMGGWAAAWFTLRHPQAVPACVLVAPAVEFLRSRWTRLSEGERASWKQTGRLRVQNEWLDTEIGYALVEEIDRYPMEQLATEWTRPLLILHGMRDEIIPYNHSLALVEQLAHPEVELRLYKNGDHRLLAFKDELAEAACQFFTRHLE